MTGKITRGNTALLQYARLESPGLWRESPASQRREVVVSFREASVVLLDPKSDIPLTHWSLPALHRSNPGELPAIYTPGEDAIETLELEEPDMIAAIEKVRTVVTAKKPKPGRLRGLFLGGGTALVGLCMLFWLPGSLREHTASVLPAATRAAIGQYAIADMKRLIGSSCETPLGTFALTALSDKLIGPHKAEIMIVREGVETAAHMPGGVIMINRRVVEEQDGPELLAGLVLAERLRAETSDPIKSALNHSGMMSTLRLLTTGVLDPSSLRGYGERMLNQKPVYISDDALLEKFTAAQISSTPYVQFIDPTGEDHDLLREGDPMKGRTSEPLMSDGDWVALQDICSASG